MANGRTRLRLCECWMSRNIFPGTSLFLSCPLKKGLDHKLYPHEKESGAESAPQRFSKQTLVAAGPGSEKGRNLHIKMYLKSESKNGFKFQYSN